jgi:hypothetical protein
MHALQNDTERIATLIMHLAERSRVVWTPELGSNPTFGACATDIAGRKISMRWDPDTVSVAIHLEDGTLFLEHGFDRTTQTWTNAHTIIERTVRNTPLTTEVAPEPAPVHETDAAATLVPPIVDAPEPGAAEIPQIVHPVHEDVDLPEPIDDLPEPSDLALEPKPDFRSQRLVIEPPADANVSEPRGKRVRGKKEKPQRPAGPRRSASASKKSSTRTIVFRAVLLVLVLAAGGYAYALYAGIPMPWATPAIIGATKPTNPLVLPSLDPALKGTTFRTPANPNGLPPLAGHPKPHAPIVPPKHHPAPGAIAKTPVRGQNDPHMANSLGLTPVAAPEAVNYKPVDDNPGDGTGGGFDYTGLWDHIEDMHDGRSEGTSSRSFHEGDSATLPFTGRHLRIYAVAGPQGGFATLRIDGKVMALLNFYAPTKKTHDLIYTSPELAAGDHDAVIMVSKPDPANPRHRFVNIDGAEYAT